MNGVILLLRGGPSSGRIVRWPMLEPRIQIPDPVQTRAFVASDFGSEWAKFAVSEYALKTRLMSWVPVEWPDRPDFKPEPHEIHQATGQIGVYIMDFVR